MTIAKLGIGDAVQDARGTVGEVVGFGRDTVSIAWGKFQAVMRYTDDELKVQGIVRWSPITRIER